MGKFFKQYKWKTLHMKISGGLLQNQIATYQETEDGKVQSSQPEQLQVQAGIGHELLVQPMCVD